MQWKPQNRGFHCEGEHITDPP